MISETDIERAVDFLRDSAEDAAQARAHRIALEEGRKSIKAMLMKEHAGEALGTQEREAYADPRYEKHLAGLREAVYQDERLRMLRAAAEAKISAWQTLSANARGIRV